VLKAAGYRTAAFCTHLWVSPEAGFGSGFDTFFTQRRNGRLTTRALQYGRRAGDRLLRRTDAGARRTNEAFLEWLGAEKGPFFAFLHYNETRLPVRLPHPHEHVFLPATMAPGRAPNVNEDPWAYAAGRARLDAEARSALAALYDAALRYVDMRVAEIAEALHARGEWERTLLVLTADHGENLGEHGLVGHEVGLYDTELHVPLLLRCPPQVPQGFVGQELAQLTDVGPTILRLLDLAGEGLRPAGRSLFDQGRATRGPSFTVSERFRPNLSAVRARYPELDTRPFEVRSKAIRTARQKFIWHSDEANELYDLVVDPGETRNLIEADAAQADDLRRQLFDWLSGVEKYESAGTGGAAARLSSASLQEATSAD
jgi:arylsulfatase A-like enzyme